MNGPRAGSTKRIKYEDIVPYLPELRKEHMTIETRADFYLGFFAPDGELLGFVGFSLKGSKAIIKHDFVFPEYRGQGIYRELNHKRWLLLRQLGVKRIEGYLTMKSLPLHLKAGATPVKHYKKSVKIEYRN